MDRFDVSSSQSNQDIYYQTLLASTIWTRLTIDYDTNLPSLSVKSLLDLSLDKLVSDNFYIRHISGRIPPLFHSLLLNRAFDKEKVLSIMYLMNQYPGQSFTFPIPDILKNWSVFLLKPNEIHFLMKPVIRNTPAAMKAFFESSNSQLQTLDMSQVFIPTLLMKNLLPILESNSVDENYSVSQQTYTLKAGLVTINDNDVKTVLDIKRASLKKKCVNIEITSLYICSLCNPGPVEELFHIMDREELLHFSLELSSFNLGRFIPELQLFRNLQTLSLSYINRQAFDSNVFTTLASALNSFAYLKQLCLRGSPLSNLLRRLLKYDCNQTYTCTRNNGARINCCIVHRGNLEYLDLSACRLKKDDLLVLQEFSFAGSLKYINLGHNFFDVSSLANFIEEMGSSLVVLDIEDCIQSFETKHIFAKFENLFKLKSLNMKELYVSFEDLPFLLRVLENMPELRQIALSKTNVFTINFRKFEKLKCNKQLKVIWSPAKRYLQP